MQLIIEHGTTRRRIQGDFRIYATKEDLQSLFQQVRDKVSPTFNVGWIDISDATPTEKPIIEWNM